LDLITLLGPSGVIAAIGEVLDRVTSQTHKRDLATFFQSADYSTIVDKIPRVAVSIFNNVFGERHLSLRCVRRSILFSSIFFFSLLALAIRYPSPFFGWIWLWTSSSVIVRNEVGQRVDLDLKSELTLWYIIGLVFDYMTILKTRILLKLATRRMWGSRKVFVLACLDTYTTYVLFGVVYLFYLDLVQALLTEVPLPDMSIWDWLRSYSYGVKFRLQLRGLWGLISHPLSSRTSIITWAAMLPLLWLWLYVLATFITGIIRVSASKGVIKFLVYFLDTDKHPYRSVGLVLSVVVALFYWPAYWLM
jgi:hypothetical protein